MVQYSANSYPCIIKHFSIPTFKAAEENIGRSQRGVKSKQEHVRYLLFSADNVSG